MKASIPYHLVYDGDFDQWLEESLQCEPMRQALGSSMTSYALMFHEPFFNIEDASINVTDSELFRWVNWCIFYGKPKNQYPHLSGHKN